MAVCCYVEGVAVCLLIIAFCIKAQEDREYYLNRYGEDEEGNTPNLNEFLQNVLNHKDDFKWIERRAKNLNLPDIGRYEKDIEPRIHKTQVFARSGRKSISDLNYEDYNDNEYEDAIRRTYRRVPGGFRGRMPRRNRLLNPNRNKRGTDRDLIYNYDTNWDDVQVYPESQYGVLHVPGDKYGYNSKRIFRSYMDDDLHSPFFSDSDDETIVVDNTISKNHGDILGLKKYRERNRKKIAEKDSGELNPYKKRSINRFANTFPIRTFDYIPKPAPVSDNTQYKTFHLNKPFNTFSYQMNFDPYANIINKAVSLNLRNFDESRSNSNTSADEEKSISELSNKHDCGVKLPITSHFEGLIYPNINDAIGNMSSKQRASNNAQRESSSEEALVLKNVNRALEIEETTVHVNSLEDVTHPTSAIEQKILGISDEMLEQNFPASTVTNIDGKKESESPGFDKLYFYGENEEPRIIGKSIPNNAYRVKGSKPSIIVANRSKNFAALSNDQHKETEKIKSSQFNEGYDDYVYDEENYKRAESEDLNRLNSRSQDDRPSSDFKQKPPQFHTRHLLNVEDKDCADCPTDTKRELPDFFKMSKEEDYKDDDVMGKQLLKKSSGEGDDDYNNADPSIGEKLQFKKKKKENESKNSQGVHEMQKLDQKLNNEFTKATVQEAVEEKEVETNVNDNERGIKLCGAGKNKVYCNMQDETEDDNYANKLKLIKGDLKKKYNGFAAQQRDIVNKAQGKHHNSNYFYPSHKPAVEKINLNQKPPEKKIKVVEISEVINPPPMMEEKPCDLKKSPIANSEYNTYSERIPFEIPPQTPEEENPMLMLKDLPNNNNNRLKMKEESNQDTIEAGFKKKLATNTDVRLKRRNKLRTYFDKLRLNKHNKSSLEQDLHYKPQNEYGEVQAPKYEINFLGPSEMEEASIRKQRSYKQPYILQSAAFNRRNSAPTINSLASVSGVQISSMPVTEEATEMYPANTKAPFQYIEYQKERPRQTNLGLNTEVAASIVDQIFEALKANSALGSTLGKGICKQTERQKNIQDLTNIDKNSTKIDIKDTQHIMQSLMIAINKIIEDKVKSRLCRKLPLPLLNYLKTIVKIPKPHNHERKEQSDHLPSSQIKTREAVDGPEVAQSDFLFYRENETPLMKRRNIRNKMKMIKSLLQDYQQMSTKCKVKMRFVRDYLEKNLELLYVLYSKCNDNETYKTQRDLEEKEKKHTAHPKGSKMNNETIWQQPIDEQLEKIGWENRNEKPLTDSDVAKIVRQSLNKGKREVHSEPVVENRRASKQYKTLVNAVEKVRNKQAKTEKIAKLFGEKRSVKNENYETIKSSNKEAQDIGKLGFNEPVVFSMDN